MARESYGTAGLILTTSGEVAGDRYGLWTGSCTFSMPVGRLDLIPGFGSVHPHAPFLSSEKFRVKFGLGFWYVSVDYAGMAGSLDESIPQYELNPGTGNDPIETHKDFLKLAGKPSAPANGAIFRDPATGEVTKQDKVGKWRFDRFSVYVHGEHNELAGCEQYINQNNTVWTKSWTSRKRPTSKGVQIKDPPGDAPRYGGNYNWLAMPVQYTMRAQVFSCQARWLGSGPRGWSKLVYPGG